MSNSSQFQTVTDFLERSLRGPDKVDLLASFDEVTATVADHVGMLERMLVSECDEHNGAVGCNV
jgi:hypothetical protein